MANKETRIFKSNTFEELRQKNNEVSLHLGDNEELNSSITDKTFNFANVNAGSTLFEGSDDDSKSVSFRIKTEETLDNTGGYIILTGSPTLTGFVADSTVTQSGGYSATIVSATTDKILVKNSSGTFNSAQNLVVGTDTILAANVVRIIAEAYNVGVVRVYINGTEISQNLQSGGFHVANYVGEIPLLNSPTITDFTEGATVYQGSNLASATFSGTILSCTSTKLRLKTRTGNFSGSTLIRVDGSSATITGANHGELSFVQNTYQGHVIELNTPASASDDIKIFSPSLVDAINELQDDVGITENLTTVSGNLVGAVNEIEAVFDASTREISAGANPFNVTSGTFTLDSDANIILDADGGDVELKDNGTLYGRLTNNSGNLIIKSGSATILTGSGNDATFANDLTITQDLSVVRNLDVDGVTTLDQTTVDGTFNVTGATDLDTTLNVDGATTLIGQLNTRADNFLGNGTGDDTTISGDLIVAVDGTVGGNFTVNGTTAEINANLDVNGNADVSGTTDLHGAVEMNSTVGIDGNFRIGTDGNNYFNVTAGSGNTQIDGNVEVDGTLGVDGNFRVGGSTYSDATFKVDESNGNTIIAGTTDITGNLTVGSLGTAAQNVKDSLNELHTQVGTVLFPGPVGLDNTTTLSVLDPTNLTTALIALDHEIGDTDSYNDGTYGAATIAGTLDLLQAGMINNDTDITNLFADVGSLSLDTTATDLTAAVNELHGEINSNDTDIGNLMTLIDGASTVDSSISFTGLAGTNLKDAVVELAAEKLDINTGGVATGALARINAGTDSIQSIVSRLNLTGNVTFNNGGTNANKMTFNTGTTLDLSSATLLLPGAASSVNIFGVGFLKVDGNTETPMGFSVDRSHVTLTDKNEAIIQWHENYADGTSQSRPARAWQLVGLNDSGVTNTADITTFYNAKELFNIDATPAGYDFSSDKGISVYWDSTNQKFGLNTDDFTVTLGTGPISGSFTVTDLANATFNTTLDNNSVTLGTHTTGNYIETLTGTTYQVSVSPAGHSEGKDATLSIPSDFRMPGTARVLSTTASSSATTGALTVAGGVGIGEDLYVAGDLYVEGTRTELNVTTLEVEDTLVLAGNNLVSEPSSGGFGIETGPITSPSGVASGVTGAHSIVYNYGTDRWEADGSLILSEATLASPGLEVNGTDVGSLSGSKTLDLKAGTGIGLSSTVNGNDFEVTINNTLDGYSGWFLSAQGDTTTYNIADDERVDFHGGTALTAVYSTNNTNRITFNHDNITTTTSDAVDDGTYIRGITVNSQGHITNIESGDFDDYYNYFTYTHPGFDGDDIDIDTGPLTGATVISDFDFNLTTNTQGHVTDANASISTRDLTLADLGYTGATNANNFTYTHPSDGGGSIDTALADATVVSKIVVNSLGHVTETATRDITLANLGYTGATDANNSTNNVTTNISITHNVSNAVVNSSDGTDGTINAATAGSDGTDGTAGIMTSADKYLLSSIEHGAEVNVQADWDSTSGDSFIQNKPSLLAIGTTSTTAMAGDTHIPADPHYTSAIAAATTTTAGLMSADDKSTLDDLVSDTGVPYYTSAIASADVTGALGYTPLNATNALTIGTTSSTAMAGNTTIPSGNAIIDWTVSQSSNIHSGNYTNTTYSVGDGGLTTKDFTSTLKTKLDGIEDSAHKHSIYGYNDGTSGYVMANGLAGTNHIYLVGGSGITLSQASNYGGSGDHGLRIACDVVNGVTSVATSNGLTGGTITSTGTLSMSGSYTGTFTASGDVVAYSDERLKDNIETLDGSKVFDMRGVTFTRNDEDGRQSSGVIAQELEKLAPELITEAEDGTKGVSYGNIAGYLIEAIKLLKEENKLIRSELENLKSINR